MAFNEIKSCYFR